MIWTAIFAYPQTPHQRRHGPRGYTDYRSFKPWLRDEFAFRCVYCLCRECWFPVGDAAFNVDHVEPFAVAPERVCQYENLAYSCCHCNSAKRDISEVADVGEEAFGKHLQVNVDGSINGLSVVGRDLIGICQFDRPRLCEFRSRMIALCQLLDLKQDSPSADIRAKYFGYPQNLPQLSVLRPPAGNARPNGISQSFYERSLRGALTEVY